MKSIILACLTGATLVQADNKCRALAFSSGDEDAVYQAGVLKGITQSSKMSPIDYAYDSVSGISGGAINTVLLSEFTKGSEQAAADRMEQFWIEASNT